jgi:hypothetical protein
VLNDNPHVFIPPVPRYFVQRTVFLRSPYLNMRPQPSTL